MKKIELVVKANERKAEAIMSFTTAYPWSKEATSDILFRSDQVVKKYYLALYEDQNFLNTSHELNAALAELTIAELSLALKDMADSEIKHTAAVSNLIQKQLKKAFNLVILG
jgi:hypothetical protein